MKSPRARAGNTPGRTQDIVGIKVKLLGDAVIRRLRATTARARGLQGVSFDLPHESEPDAAAPVTCFEAITGDRTNARRSGEPGAAPHVMLRARNRGWLPG